MPTEQLLDRRLRQLCVEIGIDAESRLFEGNPGTPVQFDAIDEIRRAHADLRGALKVSSLNFLTLEDKYHALEETCLKQRMAAADAEGRIQAIRTALGIQAAEPMPALPTEIDALRAPQSDIRPPWRYRPNTVRGDGGWIIQDTGKPDDQEKPVCCYQMSGETCFRIIRAVNGEKPQP